MRVDGDVRLSDDASLSLNRRRGVWAGSDESAEALL